MAKAWYFYDATGVRRKVKTPYFYDTGGIRRKVKSGFFYDASGTRRQFFSGDIGPDTPSWTLNSAINGSNSGFIGSGVLGGQTPPCVLGGNLCAFQWVDSTAQEFTFRFDQQGSVMNRSAFNFIQANVAGTILTFYSSGARCTEVNEWAWYWAPNVPPNLPGFPVAGIPFALVLGAPSQNALIAGDTGFGAIGYDDVVGNFNHGRQWSCINGASIVRMLDSTVGGNTFYIDLYRGTPNVLPQNYFNSVTINGQTLFTSSATYTVTSPNISRWLWNVDVGLVSGNSYGFSWN